MVQYIVKRNGEKVSFDAKKIRNAIFKANIRIAAERIDRKSTRLNSSHVF